MKRTLSHGYVLRISFLVIPSISLFIFLITPIFVLVNLSFQNIRGLAFDAGYIWFDNYLTLLRDQDFLRASWWTVKYASCSVLAQVVFGTVIALALAQLKRSSMVILCVCLLPYALPTVVGCLVWRWLLMGNHSLVNTWGRGIGLLGENFSWFAPQMVFWSIVLVSVWMFTPFVIAMCYAKLVSIPRSRYEMASTSGLSSFGSLLHVTLPELQPVLLSVLVLRALWMASKFDVVWFMAGREAIGDSARSIPVLTYITSFYSYQLSYGATMAVCMLIVLLVLTFIFFKFMGVKGKENVA